MNFLFKPLAESLAQSKQNLSKEFSELYPTYDRFGRRTGPRNEDGELYYPVGDRVGRLTDYAISDYILSPSDVSNLVADAVSGPNGIFPAYRTQRPLRMVRPDNIADQVTILPTNYDGPEKKSIFDLLEEDAVSVLTEAKPPFGERQIRASIIEQSRGEDPVIQSDPIFAPFSKYTPTVLWPYSSKRGRRYTVHDLGEEDMDWLPGKSFVEFALGREMNQVGSLPAFNLWGDPLLGVGPVVIGGTAAAVLGFTAFFWGPAIARSVGFTAKSAFFGARDITKGVLRKSVDIVKAVNQ